MYVVVCYDISSNRRRTRLHELLLSYGDPVQRSVFECDITAKQFTVLQRKARKHVKKGDSLRYYRLCSRCRKLIKTSAIPAAKVEDDDDYLV